MRPPETKCRRFPKDVPAGGAAAVLLLLAVGCGVVDESGDAAEGTSVDDGSAHPFTADGAPDGYRLAAAGRGNQEQQWGTEMGFDGAYTVIEVAGRTVVAGIVPFEPIVNPAVQRASLSGDLTPESFGLADGRSAAYGEGTDGQWDDLVIEAGPTEALRIAAESATREELLGVADHVVTAGDRAVAPVIEDPPRDWTVLGSVEAGAVVAMSAQTYPSSNEVPGPDSGYGMGWAYTGANFHEGPPASVAVMVLPGDEADLAALEVDPHHSWGEPATRSAIDVAGRPGVLVDGAIGFGAAVRSLVTHDDTGALVVVTAYGTPMPDPDVLVALAESVRPVGPSEWEQTEIAAFGGPGLNPDEGESEIARGEVDGVEWLLQTRTYTLPPDAEGATGPDTFGPLGPTSVTVDECLKLSTRERACGAASGGGIHGSLYVRGKAEATYDGVGFAPFLLITGSQERAELVRFSAGETTVEAPMHRVPDGNWDNIRAGVSMVEVPEGRPIPVCNPDPPPMEPPEGLTIARIDLFDAAGAPIGCAGM